VFELYKLLMVLYQKLEYELELITPAFIGGAFPQERAELRPASFIGILRWWFRNLALTVTDDINAVYDLESELFGDTEKAGKVWVRFEGIIESKEKNFFPYWKGNLENLSYLGYGNFMGKRILKAFLPAGEKVNLTILVPKKYEALIKNLLYIVSQFGAIGGRNRRGWGNFYLNPLSGKDYWKPYKVKKVYENFVSELCKYIPKGNPLQVIKVYEGNYGKSSPLGVLDKVGKVYKRFRNKKSEHANLGEKSARNSKLISPLSWHLQKDLKFWNVRSILISKTTHRYLTYNYAWFGLPIQIKPKPKKGRKITEYIEINLVKEKNNKEDNKEESKRLASPVLFRVFRDTNLKNYGILLIVFDKKAFYKEEKEYWFWNFPDKKVKAKLIKKEGKRKILIAEKPVSMNKDFESFINGFLNLVKPYQKHTLTLP